MAAKKKADTQTSASASVNTKHATVQTQIAGADVYCFDEAAKAQVESAKK